MKKNLILVGCISLLLGCKSIPKAPVAEQQPLTATIDLVNVQNDKVEVRVDPGDLTSENTTFYIPKTVPGTYSEDNYGKFIEGFQALDHSGNPLAVEQVDENSWRISEATELDYVTYLVNDSYDVEGEQGVFSPSGTNIEA